MVRRLLSGVAVASALAVSLTAQTHQFKLAPGCSLPFASIAPPTDGFATCDNSGGMTGHSTPSKEKQLESQAKDNLCADSSDPVPMHFEDFSRLEANTDRSQLDLKTDRNDLTIVPGLVIHNHEVGEGTVVQLVAMIRAAHISDCSRPKPGKTGGEAVNCNVLGLGKNDIHIVLMDLTADDHASECESVTAEMIPHFRPDAWSQLDLKTPVNNPVRMTGQLFYDNSHVACANGKGSPARRTVWEIHPVYQFDVCKDTTATGCAIDDASAWMPYDQWVNQPGVTVAPTGRKQRAACEAATP